MSIRISGLPLITADDLQWTYEGRKFGVELSNFEGWSYLIVVEVFANGAQPTQIGGTLETTESKIAEAGGAMPWIAAVCLPWLRAILTEHFPATEKAPAVTGFAQVDQLLKGRIRIIQRADGSLDAEQAN